jgi:hypothetical protein
LESVLDQYREDPEIDLKIDWLPLDRVAALFDSSDRSAQLKLKHEMMQAIMDGTLEARATQDSEYNLLPLYNAVSLTSENRRRVGIAAKEFFRNGGEAEIHRNDLKSWFIGKGVWPLSSELPVYEWLSTVDCHESSADAPEHNRSRRVSSEAYAIAKKLKPKIERLYKLVLERNKPLKAAANEDLMEVAIEVLEEEPSLYLPIRAEHLKKDELYNNLPDKTKKVFCGKLLKTLLEEHGQAIPDYKSFYQSVFGRPRKNFS